MKESCEKLQQQWIWGKPTLLDPPWCLVSEKESFVVSQCKHSSGFAGRLQCLCGERQKRSAQHCACPPSLSPWLVNPHLMGKSLRWFVPPVCRVSLSSWGIMGSTIPKAKWWSWCLQVNVNFLINCSLQLEKYKYCKVFWNYYCSGIIRQRLVV